MEIYIPQDLTKQNLWCVWKKEIDPKTGKNKKPCYSASKNYDGLISKKRLWQWCSYADAVAKYKNTDKYNGIGFLFHEKGDFVLIDLDNCLEPLTLKPNAFASKILKLFAGTFVEYSPSKLGLHIIIKGSSNTKLLLPGLIEVYGCGGITQYGTVTGNTYSGIEPLYMQNALSELENLYGTKLKQNPAIKLKDGVHTSLDDEYILQLLFNPKTNDNAIQFTHLFAGDFSICKSAHHGHCGTCILNGKTGRLCFRSASEADYRLVRMIKSYSKNYEQTARLFRRSALYRPKKATDSYILRIFNYVSMYPKPQLINRNLTEQNGSMNYKKSIKRSRKHLRDIQDNTVKRGYQNH